MFHHLFVAARWAVATHVVQAPDTSAASLLCAPKRGKAGSPRAHHPEKDATLIWIQVKDLLLTPAHLFLSNRERSLSITREGSTWFVCVPLPHCWYLQARILFLLVKTQACIILLLTGLHEKKHQPSVTPTVFWITRVLLIKEEVFLKRRPSPTDFQKLYYPSLKLQLLFLLSKQKLCILITPRPLLASRLTYSVWFCTTPQLFPALLTVLSE